MMLILSQILIGCRHSVNITAGLLDDTLNINMPHYLTEEKAK